MGWLPEVARAPDHAPEAEQEFAFVDDQVSIEELPLVTDAGFAASDTVGPGGAHSDSLAPPQAAIARASRGTSGNVFIRNIAVAIPCTAQ